MTSEIMNMLSSIISDSGRKEVTKSPILPHLQFYCGKRLLKTKKHAFPVT